MSLITDVTSTYLATAGYFQSGTTELLTNSFSPPAGSAVFVIMSNVLGQAGNVIPGAWDSNESAANAWPPINFQFNGTNVGATGAGLYGKYYPTGASGISLTAANDITNTSASGGAIALGVRILLEVTPPAPNVYPLYGGIGGGSGIGAQAAANSNHTSITPTQAGSVILTAAASGTSETWTIEAGNSGIENQHASGYTVACQRQTSAALSALTVGYTGTGGINVCVSATEILGLTPSSYLPPIQQPIQTPLHRAVQFFARVPWKERRSGLSVPGFADKKLAVA